MKCPQCGKIIADPAPPCRPFCSDRCKLIDLGRWISEDFRIGSADADETEGEDFIDMKDQVEE